MRDRRIRTPTQTGPGHPWEDITMKTMLGLAALAVALAAGAVAAEGRRADSGPAPEVTALDTAAPGQILFVGNSYLYYGDSLHNHVVRMARAAYPDDTFSYKSATISGAYLVQHNLDSHLEQGRLGLDDPFAVVVLQGHSTAMTTDAKRASFAEAATAMDASIRATGAVTALYMTPAYTEAHKNHDPAMMAMIDDGYTQIGNDLDAIVIPVGLAFAEAYARRPDMDLHKQDGSHPTLLGTYLAAATTYATLYDASVVGNPYRYLGAIGDADALFLQEVAEDTVAAYHARP